MTYTVRYEVPQGESSPVLTVKPDVVIEVTNSYYLVMFMPLTFQYYMDLGKQLGVDNQESIRLTLFNNKCASYKKKQFQLQGVCFFNSVSPRILSYDSAKDLEYSTHN